jgi:serine/threonine protein kinase
MRQGERINGYRILKDFTTAGGGQSMWTFAEKAGEEFFIKEFLFPVFPTGSAPGSAHIKQEKRRQCQIFENHHRRIMEVLKGKCADGSNLVITTDFFRFGSKYYKVTKKVDVSSLSVEDLRRLPVDNQVIIMRTVAHSLRILHQANIVHGDLKPSNILIKKTIKNHFAAKLIDFDSSYFSKEPPLRENLVGDLVYFSPEVGNYLVEDSKVDPHSITLKADIYALGLVFFQFLTGELPDYDEARYFYPYVAVFDDQVLRVNHKGLPTEIVDLLTRMLSKNPDDRPDIQQVFDELKGKDLMEGYSPPPPPKPKKREFAPIGGRTPSTPSPSPLRTPSRPTAEPAPSGGGLKGSLVRDSGESEKKPEEKPRITRREEAPKSPPAEKPAGSGKLKGSLMKKKKKRD